MLITALTILLGQASAPEPRVNFNFQVRPLLSDRCFKCHGPDAKTRKAGLRLDLPGDWKLKSGRPFEAELLARITSSDPDRVMPPPDNLLTLSAREKQLIRDWIAGGAEYSALWSLIPVGDPPAPVPRDSTGLRNPVDAFVRARLESENISPAPEASPESLIRRLCLDLTGLPPDLEEIDRFVSDDSPGAYESLVDRLLASATYGERRANEWLDLARYADTYGYQSDVERDMSPWRDWVIRAFNENLSFDQFVTWQVAGDLLPAPTRDQVLATAFHRLHRQTNEGGSIDEEFRVEYVADRVQTFGTAFLGLTLECARCHDHKYDPLTQKDYYQLSAFFANIDESGLYSHFTQATPTPTLFLYPEGLEAKHTSLKAEIAAREAALNSEEVRARARFEAWAASGGHATAPAPSTRFSLDEVINGQTPNESDASKPGIFVETPELCEGKKGKALRFSGDNSVVLGGTGDFNRTTPFTLAFWIRPSERQERAVVLHRSRAWSDSGSRGYEVVLEQGHPSFALVHFWPGNAIKIRATEELPLGQWTHLAVTYDGSSRAAGLAIHRNGQDSRCEIIRDNLYKDILHRREWGDADVGGVELTLAARFRDNGFRGGALDELVVFPVCLSALEASALAGRSPVAADREAYLDHFVRRVDVNCLKIREELLALRTSENNLVNDVREIMVMREMSPPRQSFILRRGAYQSPTDPVDPGTPERILPFSNDLPRNRLGLARWLTDARNPLTVRVVVNRAWTSLFGRGLVGTAEDFGSQGELPTHPELLEWLSRRFMDSGWELKALFKLLAMSATYRQSSRAPAELLTRDPENRLLARGPRARLEAEQIRDSALFVSGLLSRKIGGRSVKPYQPAGLWEEAGTGKTYVQDSGDKLYRRSLYTFWRRTAPPPTMLTFDATSREVCVARRESTSTPLQSLALLNDPQFVEAARALAEKLVRESHGCVDERILKAFRLTTGRRPDNSELEILRRLHSEQLDHFRSSPGDTAKYLKTGDRPTDATLPADQVAATAVMASTLMNLDEFVTKR